MRRLSVCRCTFSIYDPKLELASPDISINFTTAGVGGGGGTPPSPSKLIPPTAPTLAGVATTANSAVLTLNLVSTADNYNVFCPQLVSNSQFAFRFTPSTVVVTLSSLHSRTSYR